MNDVMYYLPSLITYGMYLVYSRAMRSYLHGIYKYAMSYLSRDYGDLVKLKFQVSLAGTAS